MDRSLFKLLLISALSAGLVVPLFFYSRSLMRQAEQALAEVKAADEAALEAADDSKKQAHNEPSDNRTDEGHGQAEPRQAKVDEGAHGSSDGVHGGKPSQAQATAIEVSQPSTVSHATDKSQAMDGTSGKVEEDDSAQAYKPPLFGSCKRMFQQLQKREVAEGEYKAFAFAFDGKWGNCADYVSNKSLRHARAVVVKNCQEERAHDKRYVACLLYEVQ